MSLTRDQLRAARALLHLRQPELAQIARIGVATIRRFEGGQEIGHLHLKAIRQALVDAGAVLIDAVGNEGLPPGATGVVLPPDGELPEPTMARITSSRANDAAKSQRVGAVAKGSASGGRPTVGRGRPRKVSPEDVPQADQDAASGDAGGKPGGPGAPARGRGRPRKAPPEGPAPSGRVNAASASAVDGRGSDGSGSQVA